MYNSFDVLEQSLVLPNSSVGNSSRTSLATEISSSGEIVLRHFLSLPLGFLGGLPLGFLGGRHLERLGAWLHCENFTR